MLLQIPETYTNTFMMRSHGPVNSHFFQCIYIANYGTSFPLLSAHFVYRALTLRWFVKQILSIRMTTQASISSSFPKISRLHYRNDAIHGWTMVPAILSEFPTPVASFRFFVGFVSFSADEESRVITRPLMSGLEWSPIVHTNDTEELYVVGTYWVRT